MAIVKLEKVTVNRMHGSGHGLQVIESKESNGKTYSTTFTLWFKEPHGLQVGDVVSVSGFLSAKVGDPWTGNDGQERRSVESGVNSPRIEKDSTTSGPVSQSEPSAGPWATDTHTATPTPQTHPQNDWWTSPADTEMTPF